MDLGFWSPTAWAAIGACATFLVYVLIGIYAVLQYRVARELRQQQTRPWVLVDFEPGFVFHLVIENIGRTVARNVQIRFEPPLASTLQRPWPWEESTLLSEGIPLLPPGRKLRLFFDSFGARMESDLPKVYGVHITYDGPLKDQKGLISEDKLDFRFHHGTEGPRKGMPELVKTLGEVKDEMKKWTDGTKGLLTFNYDREKYTRAQDRRHWILLANRVREEHGWLGWARYLVERALQRRGWLSR